MIKKQRIHRSKFCFFFLVGGGGGTRVSEFSL